MSPKDTTYIHTVIGFLFSRIRAIDGTMLPDLNKIVSQ